MIPFVHSLFDFRIPGCISLRDRRGNTFEVIARLHGHIVYLCQGWGALGVFYKVQTDEIGRPYLVI